MNITVVGGGNVGTLIAGLFTQKGHKVTIHTRDKSKWCDEITVFDKDTDTEFTYKPFKITDSIEEAVREAKIIFVVLPAFAISEFIKQAEKFIPDGTWIGYYPGTGGVEFVSGELLKKNCVIFGTQRICSVARLNEYGKSVVTAGKRKNMYISAIPLNHLEEVSKQFDELFDTKTELLPNYLNVTLTPSNPLLHTARLYDLFKDYTIGQVYDRMPLFYGEWTDESSKCLIECDNELHQILNKIPFDTSYIIPLLEHYESTDYKSLTNKITTIPSLATISTPSVKVENGVIPDLNSRYFTADFPYGLVIIKAFGMVCNVNTPCIDKIIDWYQKLIGKQYIDFENNKLGKDSNQLALPQLNSINTVEDIVKFYTLKK